MFISMKRRDDIKRSMETTLSREYARLVNKI
jgi:hypothetical protein